LEQNNSGRLRIEPCYSGWWLQPFWSHGPKVLSRHKENAQEGGCFLAPNDLEIWPHRRLAPRQFSQTVRERIHLR
jgi:hypothetical protein